jgi:hypothetical protein
MTDHDLFPDPHHKDQNAAATPHTRNGGKNNGNRNGGQKPRCPDRRPKGIHPMRKRTISLTHESDRLAENETHRRGLPSVSAFIEHAIAKEARHKEQPEEFDLLHLLDEVRLSLARIERESAERDVLAFELLAGVARTQFALLPTPAEDERQARIAHANQQFEKLLDAVGRRVESGQTTLSQMPDPPAVSDAPASEENISPADAGVGMTHEQV